MKWAGYKPIEPIQAKPTKVRMLQDIQKTCKERRLKCELQSDADNEREEVKQDASLITPTTNIDQCRQSALYSVKLYSACILPKNSSSGQLKHQTRA